MDTVWEYRVFWILTKPHPYVQDLLNKIGQHGWELVSIGGPALDADLNQGHNYFFKRKTRLADPSNKEPG